MLKLLEVMCDTHGAQVVETNCLVNKTTKTLDFGCLPKIYMPVGICS